MRILPLALAKKIQLQYEKDTDSCSLAAPLSTIHTTTTALVVSLDLNHMKDPKLKLPY